LFAEAARISSQLESLSSYPALSEKEKALSCWDFVARGLMYESGSIGSPFNSLVPSYMCACGAPLAFNYTTARRELYLLRARVREGLSRESKLGCGWRLRYVERFSLTVCAEMAERCLGKRQFKRDMRKAATAGRL
jgi:hypothetical protein